MSKSTTFWGCQSTRLENRPMQVETLEARELLCADMMNVGTCATG